MAMSEKRNGKKNIKGMRGGAEVEKLEDYDIVISKLGIICMAGLLE